MMKDFVWFAGWGALRDCGMGGFAGCGIIQMRDFRNAGLNPALFQCGIVVLLTLTLASCLKLGHDLSTEPPQVPGFKTLSVLPENQTTAGGLPGNWLWFKSQVLFSN